MRLGRQQLKMLNDIVATNGGGIYSLNLDRKIMLSLAKKDLIQGKRGDPSFVVHTSLGLKIHREVIGGSSAE